MSDIIPEKVKRSIRYDLNAKEIHDYSLQLATQNKQLVSIEEEKKTVVSQYKAKENEAQALINKLSAYITDGFEMRDIDCEVQYHKPQQGKKTIVRLDTNKVTAVETMTDYEWNLFNQPDLEESDLIKDAKDDLRGKKKSGKKGKQTPENPSGIE